MMDPEFADLVPLFVGEARGRIENLSQLATRIESDAAALPEIKRELHTLKGAGRMLGLTAVAELCHAAEGWLQGGPSDPRAVFTSVVDALAGMVDTVDRGEDPQPHRELIATLAGTQPRAPVTAQAATTVAPARSMSDDIRVETGALDALADRATRLRILAHSAGSFSERLSDLARLAEEAVRDPQPAQALAVLATSIRRIAIGIDSGQQRWRRLSEAHLEQVLSLQLQPLRGCFLNLSRHARELARSMSRELEVATEGDDTKLDRRIVHVLDEALVHLVRNAVDHGLEPPKVRESAGKPRRGTLRLAAASTGPRVRITIQDDGSGIDSARVVRAAVEAGLVDEAAAQAMSRDEILRLVFTPGFSTRRDVSELSGRGIGMDVVVAAVSRIGGGVEISSEPGRGTSVFLDVPAALRGEVIMVVGVGRLRLALPSSVVRTVHRLAEKDIVERDGRTLANLGDRMVPFVSLARAFGETPRAQQLLLEGTLGGQALALAVDAVEGEQEVLLRPLSHLVPSSPLIEGVALLASGEPVGVLSPLALAHRDMSRSAPVARPHPQARKLRVLLVDDSLVTREMERRLLEDAGFEVVAASDAGEALANLTAEPFDCLVTDIEMPWMDGFELTRQLRRNPQLAHLPVVVVSTRDRPEDRLHGLEAGADAYLTKQGLDADELVSLVRRLGGR